MDLERELAYRTKAGGGLSGRGTGGPRIVTLAFVRGQLPAQRGKRSEGSPCAARARGKDPCAFDTNSFSSRGKAGAGG